jgi:hypothetical protein
MSAAGEGAADKEKGKDRRTVSTAFPTPARERVTEMLRSIPKRVDDPFFGP